MFFSLLVHTQHCADIAFEIIGDIIYELGLMFIIESLRSAHSQLIFLLSEYFSFFIRLIFIKL